MLGLGSTDDQLTELSGRGLLVGWDHVARSLEGIGVFLQQSLAVRFALHPVPFRCHAAVAFLDFGLKRLFRHLFLLFEEVINLLQLLSELAEERVLEFDLPHQFVRFVFREIVFVFMLSKIHLCRN